ncbi:MAG: hypothetical protein MRJ65_08860 [Candidatus Brocadiaceae bacterium]|nr:hypothetical protein [Candidatus Brocadiaceae bacterium]
MFGGMWSIPTSNKIFFTFFLSFVAIAIGLGFLNYFERTGFSHQKTVRYYCGDKEEDFDVMPSAEEAANIMEEGLFFPKTYRELLEVTHAHVFSIPIVVFILSRILAMTQTQEWLKITIYCISFAGVLLNLGAPWLIRYAHPLFAFTVAVSSIFLLLSFVAYIFIPLYEMWFGKKT